MQVKYLDGSDVSLTVDQIELVEAVTPFNVTQSVTNLQGDKVDHLSPYDDFCLHFSITNLSKASILLKSCGVTSDVRYICKTISED